MTPLKNPQHETFCQYYVYGENGQRLTAEKALILAGYSAKSCRQNTNKILARPGVRDRIKELLDASASEKIMSFQEMCEKLTLFARADDMASDSIKAMDALAKLRRYYPKDDSNKVEVTVNNAVQVKLDADTLKAVATSLGNVGAVRLGAIDLTDNQAQ